MDRVQHLVQKILKETDSGTAADAAIRQALREDGSLGPGEKKKVSESVFAVYRWAGWTRGEKVAGARIRRSVELDQQFGESPNSLSPAEMADNVVPPWTRDCVAVTAEWLKALQSQGPLWLRARPGKARSLASTLGESYVPAFEGLDIVEYRGDEDLFRSQEFHSGAFEIQDLSSQAVGAICAPKSGEKWLDACAGEGGKTLHLADQMGNKGLVWASDRSLRRLEVLKRRMARARIFNYRTAAWDWAAGQPTRALFDGVLVDAPCSGLGTWHRNPHARWTTTPKDVEELAAIQLKILGNTSKVVKPGGRLVYAVCTLTRPETEDVASAFSSAHPEFEPAPFKDPLRPKSVPKSVVWYWPQEFGGNGMYVSCWKRRKAQPAA